MIQLNHDITPASLAPKIERLWDLSAAKINAIEAGFDATQGAPVYTVEGQYTTRGWTEWTQGFQFGAAILQYDATGDEAFLEMGRRRTVDHMASHVTHFGVHDHGFNNVSTYGNLLRLMREGRIADDDWERAFYEMALKASAAVQARRWTTIAEDGGYIYSFNGPHSLFADTIRSLRALAVGHRLGHMLKDEHDESISLLDRLVQHARATAQFTVYYGDGRDGYDVRGRVAHESIFNLNDGQYRCPNSQQGYSGFTTWTRGLAWVMCGYAEELEFLAILDDATLEPFGGRTAVEGMMREAAQASCDFYIDNTPTCGVPYWDTGAPNLHRLGDYLDRPADPFNEHEPVDSSAAAIAAQGLLRLGHYLNQQDEDGSRYTQAGLQVLGTLLEEPYLSTDTAHQGLILHSVYHWPNRWDHVPDGQQVACGESTMWGDYHAREVALYVQRLARGEPYLAFYNVV
ncbi:MAG TPA: hypothetical protein VKP65_11315 [Rhodothermales bacterium]|nr:hypothetical protein [Rhodothermales bacterium]